MASGGAESLPSELAPRRLGRRFLVVIALRAVLVLVVLSAPGLGDVRDRLEGAAVGWLVVAVALEGLSCGGAIAFATLRRALDRAERPDLCVPVRAA